MYFCFYNMFGVITFNTGLILVKMNILKAADNSTRHVKGILSRDESYYTCMVMTVSGTVMTSLVHVGAC